MPSEYKFQVEERSLTLGILTKYIFNPIISRLPIWFKPNTITVCSAFFMLLSALFIWFAFNGMRWGFLAAAVCVFLYLTGDNVDGPHARRTGQTSQLGEFLDHWLDSINLLIINLCVIFVLDLQGWILVLYMVSATLSFFATIWEQHHTGIFYSGRIGTNEGLLIAIVLYLLLFFYFKTPLFIYQGPLKINAALGIAYLVIVGGIILILGTLLRVRKNKLEYIPIILVISVISTWFLTGLIDKFFAALFIFGINIPFCGHFLLGRITGKKSTYRFWIVSLLAVIEWVVLFLKESISFPIEVYIIYLALTMIVLAILWDLLIAVSVLNRSKKSKGKKPILT